MPLHDYDCPRCHVVREVFTKIEELPNEQFCPCGGLLVRLVSAPFVRGDIEGYTSPIDGSWIGSRAQRREDLRRNHCVEFEPGLAEGARRSARETELREEASLDHTIDATIAQMPVRQREALAGEMEGGLTAEIQRR